METKEIFEQTGRIGNEIKRMRYILDSLNARCLGMMEICPHEIVFQYKNHSPKKETEGNYFCPACGKNIQCFLKNQVKDTEFKESKIIPLPNLSLLATKETYSTIRREVYQNMDYYYSSDVTTEEMTLQMEEVLQEQLYLSEPNKTLTKKKNR